MNTEELKTFIYLSKVKNFTLCADQLSIAQSTVTNRINELEKELGKRLFSRVSKTVKLTEEGQIFLPYAERMIELQESSIKEMNATSSHRRKFAIGAINATYEVSVRPLIDKCMADNNQTSIKVILGHSLDLIQQLQDNVLDMVFSAVSSEKSGLRLHRLRRRQSCARMRERQKRIPQRHLQRPTFQHLVLNVRFNPQRRRRVYPFPLPQKPHLPFGSGQYFETSSLHRTGYRIRFPALQAGASRN